MTPPTRAAIRSFLVARVAEQLAEQDRAVDPASIDDECDLLLSGLVDSLGVLELVGSLSEFCGFELDLDDLDPDDLTIVGPLCDYVAAQVAARSG